MGKVFVEIPGIEQQTTPLYAANDVQELNFVEKFLGCCFKFDIKAIPKERSIAL